MSKILIAGDWHGNHPWAKTIIDVAVAENIDCIMQCGDFGIWPGKEGQEYINILSRYLTKQNKKYKRKIKLFFVLGNHEDYNQVEQWELTLPKNEDGHIEIALNIFHVGKVNSWTWEGKKFASVGGAVSIDRKWRKLNESWWQQETLTDEELAIAMNMGEIDYLFTHDCPTTHPFYGLKNDIESDIHRQKMTQAALALKPKIWFHGHMHQYAEYTFDHRKGTAKVYSLDADSKASRYPSLQLHAAVLDTDTDEVYSIDKHFNWWAKSFYFDKKHEQQSCSVCNK